MNLIETKHHEFSPSKMDRLESCPWSYKNCLGWTPEGGDDASRGTLLHAAIYDDEAYGQLSDRERGMIDFIRAEHIKPYESRKDLQHFHELKVQVHLDGVLITEGTLDDLVISADGKTASLKDWKFGSYEVPPADINRQIKSYVCGIFEKFPTVEKVYAMIVQPVYGAADYDKQVCFTRSQHFAMLLELAEITTKAKNAVETDANPKAENCRYCNKFGCKAYRAKMITNFVILSVNGDELTEPEKELTLDYADRMMCAKREIESLMESRTELAKKVILDAGGSANFRVQAGRLTKRTNWKKLAADFNIPQDAIDAATMESEGSPYLMPRMRRKTGTLPVEAAERG